MNVNKLVNSRLVCHNLRILVVFLGEISLLIKLYLHLQVEQDSVRYGILMIPN